MLHHNLPPSAVEVHRIKTTGDLIQDRPLSEVGGKGLFTKELEVALLAGEIDFAVHSMKDVATVLPNGLTICTVLDRENVQDAFISLKYDELESVPEGATIGTSSIRRRAQLSAWRPDLKFVEFRGNVQTRLKKLKDGIADATLLAVAGLKRLGMAERITSRIDTAFMLPAAAQGAVGIEIRQDDEEIKNLLQPLNHEQTALCVAAERAFLAHLDGSCRTPIGALAEFATSSSTDCVTFRGQILSPDGKTSFEDCITASAKDIVTRADDMAKKLRNSAGPDFFADLTQRN